MSRADSRSSSDHSSRRQKCRSDGQKAQRYFTGARIVLPHALGHVLAHQDMPVDLWCVTTSLRNATSLVNTTERLDSPAAANAKLSTIHPHRRQWPVASNH